MKIPRKFLISTALALVLFITLLAGLKPKGYRFLNDVTWAQHNTGITIGPMGIAYSRDSLQWTGQDSRDSGFTIEMSIKANKFQTYGIAKILGFWDGIFPEPLIVGQWRNHLIVRVRDMHIKRGYREFDADTILKRGKKELIQIISTRSKTAIFVNGIRTGDSLYTSVLPKTGLWGRLVLGNSATADRPWSGEIYGIALYQRKLSSEEISLRFSQWDSSGRTFLPPATRVTHFFQFNEGQGPAVHDCVASGFDLQIPRVFHIVKKQVLVGPWDDFRWDFAYFSDIIINLLGFIPLGLFMALFLFVFVPVNSRKKNVLLTILICFIVSFCIELAQVYIPTRSSQLSDLIFNTAGGAIGGLLAKMQRVTLTKK
jgi:VanZ like family.